MYCTINAAGNTLTKQFYRDEKKYSFDTRVKLIGFLLVIH